MRNNESIVFIVTLEIPTIPLCHHTQVIDTNVKILLLLFSGN